MTPSSPSALAQGPRRRRRHLFQNARLNGVGRAALVAASLASAALGAAVAALAGLPWWVGAILGLPIVLVVLVALDRRRTSRRTISFGWTEDLAEVESVARAVRARGVEVTVEPDGPSLVFRRRDERVVAGVLGLPRNRPPWSRQDGSGLCRE
jgi:hypothetical protein